MITRDLGQYVISALAVPPSDAVADSVTDNVEVVGETIDRMPSTGGDIAKSAVVLVPYTATLSQEETVSFAVEIQESSDGSSWDTAEVLQASTVAATGESGGSTEVGCLDFNVDLGGSKRYFRINVTPDLSQIDTPDDPQTGPANEFAEATDAVSFAAVALLDGYRTVGSI